MSTQGQTYEQIVLEALCTAFALGKASGQGRRAPQGDVIDALATLAGPVVDALTVRPDPRGQG